MKKKIIITVATVVSILIVILLAGFAIGLVSGSICLHSFDRGTTLQEPTCTEDGVRVYTCSKCDETKEEILPALGHELGEWKMYKAPTPYEEGEDRAKCKRCIYYETRKTDKISSDKHIAVDDGSGKLTYVDVSADGSYTLTVPERLGYIFKEWVDAEGNSFASSGKVNGPTLVKAVWEIEGTDTLAELIERAAAGVDEIKITADITVTEPIFFIGTTKLFADGNYTLKRAADYAGDIFVVGQNKDGVGSPLLFTDTELTLGGGKGTLTVDGNKDNIIVTVVGSALFVTESSKVNLYDGIVISNNKKLGNSRTDTCEGFANIDILSRAGGAAIMLINGSVNMYGGIIENNIVMTEPTVIVGDDGAETKIELGAFGGAIYNRSNFNMYGGIIRNSESLRGGAIYNDEIVYLVGGIIANNKSHTYGGAVSSSSSAEAQMFIGSAEKVGDGMLFEGNISLSAGGALYSNTNSPIVIYGNTVFSGNSTENSSGGAIYTGGALTVRGATFIGNFCKYSGGAIYHHFSNPERERRNLELTDCVFEENSASLGGAVMLSAADTSVKEGTYAEITNCAFNSNHAVQSETGAGNGGAVYTTRHSDAKFVKCEFNGNTATTNAGALSVHSGATVRVNECLFNENKATYGGAMYLSSDSETAIIGSNFNENSVSKDAEGRGGNGGAILANGIELTIENTKFTSNSAENHAGAIYQSTMTLSLGSDVSFEGNSAGNHGGAIYLTYSNNPDGTKKGSTLKLEGTVFIGNTALSGGAISARSESVLTVNGVLLKNNTAPLAAVGTADGGGAIYANNSKLNITDVIMDGNASGYYGGTLKLDTCETVMKNVSITNSSGGTGGAIYASAGEIELEDLTLTGNTASMNGVVYLTRITTTFNKLVAENNTAVNGGVLYASGSAVIGFADCSFKGNHASKGGAIYTDGGKVTVPAGNLFSNNSAKYGGAIMAINAASVSVIGVPFESNEAEIRGGAIAIEGAALTIGEGTTFENNSSGSYGGAISVHDYTDTVEVIPEGATEPVEETVTVDASLSIEGVTFKNNSSSRGGALYISQNEYSVNNTVFEGNSAIDPEYGGGAIYNTGAIATLDNVAFVGNTSHKGGAIALHSESEMAITSMAATGNSATANGAGSMGHGGVFYVNNSTLTLIPAENAAIVFGGDAEGTENSAVNGGAIYADSKASVTVENVAFTGNRTSGNGGAICATGGEIRIVSVSFENNSAKGNGGAVYLSSGSEIALENATANNNVAGGHGGAIYATKSTVTVLGDNTLFSNNSASGHGGAIYLSYQTSGEEKIGAVLQMTGGVFSGNTALAGGAISARTNCKIELIGTKLQNNEATGTKSNEGGGAIYTNNNTLILSGVTLDGNSGAYYGGAITVLGATVEIKDNTVIKNSEGSTGAAIYIREAGSKVTITDSTVSNNNAKYNGVIYMTQAGELTVNGLTASGNTATQGGVFYVSGGIVTLNNVNASGNSAKANGGVIFVTSADMTVNGSSFSENTATDGGVIFVTSADMTVNGSSFSKNTATDGGVIFASKDAELTVNGSSFTENSASKGGALYVEGAIVEIGSDEEGNKTLFDGNTTTSNGGAIYVGEYSYTPDPTDEVPEPETEIVKSTVTVDGAELLNNTAANGGAIYAEKGATVNVSNASFKENVANTNGGAIYVGGSSNLNVNNATFEGNSAGNYGGAINVSASVVTVIGENTLFKNNSAVKHGGAIYASYSGSVYSFIEMTGGRFEGNTAMAGGAVSIRSNCQATFNGTVFSGNSVSGDDGTADGNGEGGGAIYEGYGKLILVDVEMTGNIASVYGGAISAVGGTVTATGGEFKNNTAARGGAINLVENCNASFTDTKFTANSATGTANTEGGGAINAEKGSLILFGVIMDGNTSAYYGGAINARKGTVEIKDSVITNSKGSTGAALYFREAGTKVTVTNSTVSYNNAVYNGAIYMTQAGELTVNGLVAEGNEANQGSVFYVSGGTITLNNVNASGNSAKTNGGVFYIGGAVVTVSDSTFDKNSAKNGGVAYVASGRTTVTNTEITNNTATEKGGAVYAKGGELTLGEGTVASGNTATENGGAIFAEENATVTVNRVFLTNNEAAKGGAIFATKNSSVIIEGASFTGNSASYGGAIFAEGATLNVNSDAEGNKTLFKNNSATSYGGAIYVNDYTFTPTVAEGEPTPETEVVDSVVAINGARFEGNTALRAGAVYIAKTEGYVISNADFVSNSATDANYGGGAIYSTESKGILDAVTFTGNTSHKGGAVALHSASEMTVASLTATGNTATLNSEGNLGAGGVFYVNNATLNLVAGEGKTICFGGEADEAANTANNGGAVYAENGAVLNVNNAVFEGNAASNHGGAIYAMAATVTVLGEKTLFKNNSAIKHGGAIYASYSGKVYSFIEMTSGRFEGNTAMAGGAVSVRSNCQATFTGTVFSGNSVTGDDGTADGNGEGGGAIYEGYGKLILVDVEMIGNTASVYGGAISAVGGTVTATGGEFKNNTAVRGGAINLVDNCNASFTNTKFTANSATGKANNEGGGAINAEKGSLILSGVIMNGNTSAYYGGAINARKGTVEITDTVITNSQGSTGAALYFRENETKVTITNSTISNNNAKYNGAIYMTQAGELTVNGLTASGNTADKGGVFYVSGGIITITGLNSQNNTAKNGGNVLNASGSADVTVNYTSEDELTVWNAAGAVNGIVTFTKKSAN